MRTSIFLRYCVVMIAGILFAACAGIILAQVVEDSEARQNQIEKRTAKVGETKMPKDYKLLIQWLGHTLSPDYELGLRSDGVVVWRR